ncbi:MAG TPA: zinc-ribbon domain-containing protein, partial [Myxococcales bacterium]|nr:zinc-ribbon domain-containing protein [Myxococcales bacterium]
MVVQCPSCQTRFRVADEKVGDRTVRVRCSSCKDVFPVKKSGGAEAGIEIDLSLDPPVPPAKKGGTGPAKAASPPAGKAPPPPSKQAPKPKGSGPDRLDVDDLFGMAELTGGAGKPAAKAKSEIDFDALDLLEDEPLAPAKPSTGPQATGRPITGKTKPKTGPIAPLEKVKTGPQDADGRPKPKTGPHDAQGRPKPKTGPLSAPDVSPSGLELDETAYDKKGGIVPDLSVDPFQSAAALGRPPSGPVKPDSKPISKPRTDKKTQSGKQYKSIFQKPAEPPPSARRDLISSALTGLIGAALAVVVVLVAAQPDEGSSGWLGTSGRSDVVATRVVSGLYDTASGRPVFYVRGRVENRGRKRHGPVRVIAELIAGGETEGKGETIAGAEPNPEDVYAL